MKKLALLMSGIMAMFLIAGTPIKVNAQEKNVEKTALFEVSMHCNSCKAKIERDIAFEKGVKAVTADIDTKIVTVKYVEGKTTEEKIAEAIKKLGYDVKVIKEEKKEETPKK